MSLLSVTKPLLYPWLGLLPSPTYKSPRPYFGPPSLGLGGPALKRVKLKWSFSNYGWRPNIVYVTSGLPMSVSFLRWAKSRGAKILINQDGVYSPSWYRGDYKGKNDILSDIHQLSDYTFYQSRFCQSAAQTYLRVPPGQKSEILYNGVDLQLFSPPESRLWKRPRLFCAGYFYPGKHYILKTLLKAFALLRREIPDAELHIAGKIEGTFEKGEAVYFYGPYPYSNGPDLFRSMDVFVHLKNNDPCPSIVLEAMASGLAVVYCDNGGTPELVGEAGVPIRHSAPLDQTDQAPEAALVSAAMGQALRDRQTLAGLARRQAEKFSLSSWLERQRQVMNDLLPHA